GRSGMHTPDQRLRSGRFSSHECGTSEAGGRPLYRWDRSGRPERGGSTDWAFESERLQIFDQVVLLLRGQAQLEEVVVVIPDSGERRKAAIVIEAALLMRPNSLERRRAVAPVGCPIGLEVVDPDLGGRVEVPARLAEERGHVASSAT